jgi:predicted RNA-binding protein with PIN domain
VNDCTWVVDGNNVFGSRPDRWWNDPSAAKRRLAQHVAEWCRTHDDPVILVFDAPVASDTLDLAGGKLTIEGTTRRGHDAADDRIVELAAEIGTARVVTSDHGLRRRLVEQSAGAVELVGVSRFRQLIGY